MSTATQSPLTGTTGASPRPPTRFREAENRSRRLGRPLRLAGRIREVDESMMARIGEQLMARDELGGALAQAMRMRAGTPGRVSRADLRTALRDGLTAVDRPAPALSQFVTRLSEVPQWVDWDLLAEGQRAYNSYGQNAADVLTQLSLIGGYRFGGPTDVLVATGSLSGDMTRRRLAETQAWTVSLSQPDGLRPGGEAWQLTLHVRAMHALVNATFEPTWDIGRWGLPINLTDLTATQGLFDGVLLLGVRALGVPVSRGESRAVMHLWKYVGWLLGVPEDWLVDSESERHRLNYHMLLAQSGISDAGAELSRAIVQAQAERSFPHAQRVSRWLARERLLSMLTVFLGVRSMVELGLPARPPWAHAYLIALNTVRYRVLGRTRWGRGRLERWGDRTRERMLTSYYGNADRDLGTLPV